MALIPVRFEYLTGLRQPFAVSARLTGNWNAVGLRSEQWATVPMEAFTAEWKRSPPRTAAPPFGPRSISTTAKSARPSAGA